MNLGVIIMTAIVFLLPGQVAGQRLKFGSGLKTHPVYLLPGLAAEEKGFWKEQGLSVEWLPFEGTAAMMRATAARAVEMGLSDSVSQLQAAGAGLPVIIVAHVGVENDFFIWVRSDSPIKEPKDLRGVRIGVNVFGGAAHAYLRAVAKELSLEKEIKAQALGGLPHMVAALRAGRVEALMITLFFMAPLKVKGEAREVLAVPQFLPRPWINRLVFSRKDFLASQAETVRKAIRAVLTATAFIMANQEWAVAKMVAASGFSEPAARLVFPALQYSKDGKTDPRGIENVRQFLMDYGIVAREKTPPARELFTNEFIG